MSVNYLDYSNEEAEVVRGYLTQRLSLPKKDLASLVPGSSALVVTADDAGCAFGNR